MAYGKQNFTDGEVLTAAQLTHIEDGIIELEKRIDNLSVVSVPIPAEVDTENEMTALLDTAEVGSVYKYTGESGTYENGTLYIVSEE